MKTNLDTLTGPTPLHVQYDLHPSPREAALADNGAAVFTGGMEQPEEQDPHEWERDLDEPARCTSATVNPISDY